MLDQSQDLLYTLHIFFYISVFIFPEIVKHNMLKMWLFSSTFNIKMATQKFSNFDKDF